MKSKQKTRLEGSRCQGVPLHTETSGNAAHQGGFHAEPHHVSAGASVAEGDQKLPRTVSWPAGCLPSCWGVFCPRCFSGSTFSHFCAGVKGQFPLDLQWRAAGRTSACQPRAAPSNAFEEQRHLLLGGQFKFRSLGLHIINSCCGQRNLAFPDEAPCVPPEEMTRHQERLPFFIFPLIYLCLNFPICKCLLPSAELAVNLLLPPAE